MNPFPKLGLRGVQPCDESLGKRYKVLMKESPPEEEVVEAILQRKDSRIDAIGGLVANDKIKTSVAS